MTDEVFHPPVEELTLPKVLAALADPARLTIVQAIAAAENGLACTLLPEQTGLTLSKSTMSHHQRILRQSGVTRTRIQGSRRILRLRREDLEQRFPGLLAAVLGAQPGPIAPAPAPTRKPADRVRAADIRQTVS